MNENAIQKETGYPRRKIVNEKTVNFLLIFILGFLVGVAVKTEAKKRVTMGYGDYLAQNMRQGFDLMKPEPKASPEGSLQTAPAGNGEQDTGAQGQ